MQFKYLKIKTMATKKSIIAGTIISGGLTLQWHVQDFFITQQGDLYNI